MNDEIELRMWNQMSYDMKYKYGLQYILEGIIVIRYEFTTFIKFCSLCDSQN